MKRLSEAADHVSRNINARRELPEYRDRTDEVGQMAHAFSAMTAALYRRVEASESFAADVAHELKNPLAAARSMAESLAYAKTEAQRAELVRQIQNELRRLNRLITDVSDASRLDAELARQQMAPFDVTGVVTSVSQIFRDILSSDSRKLVPVFDPAPFEGAFLVNGDPGRLGQVLTNLVDNAVSFSPDGCEVKLTVCRRDSTVELGVDDQGPGIPEDRLNIIFDRFYTDRPATEAARGKNSGLGLSISREIVRAHGGEIVAETRYAERRLRRRRASRSGPRSPSACPPSSIHPSARARRVDGARCRTVPMNSTGNGPELFHGTAVALGAEAALIRGASGSGKSDLALRCISMAPSALIPAQARLVADDQVLIERNDSGLVATCPAQIRGKIEVRGIGIVAVEAVPAARLVLVVDLVPATRCGAVPARRSACGLAWIRAAAHTARPVRGLVRH